MDSSLQNVSSYAGLISVLLHIVHGGYLAFHHCKLRSKCCGKESEISFSVDQDSPIIPP
jgi:hypothetical protein